MTRRELFAASAAIAVFPTFGRAYSADIYTPQVWRDIRRTSEPVILNYRASWSLTCQIKADIIAELIAKNPDYARLRFVDVDWDTFGPSQVTQNLRVERRSTLLLVRKGRELARIVNEPFVDPMRAFLDTALRA